MYRVGLVLVFVTGCMGSASVYYQDRGGGVLALHDDEDRAMKDARDKMAAHCGAAGYEVVKRETVVVGQENYSNSQRNYGEDQASARAKDTASTSHREESYQGGSTTAVQHGEAAAATDSGYVAGSETVVAHDTAGHAEATSSDASSTRALNQTTVRGGETTSAVTGTRQVTETRITYVCGGEPPRRSP